MAERGRGTPVTLFFFALRPVWFARIFTYRTHRDRNLIWTINRQTSRIPICVFACAIAQACLRLSSSPPPLLQYFRRTSTVMQKSTKTNAGRIFDVYSMMAARRRRTALVFWRERAGPLRALIEILCLFIWADCCGLGKVQAICIQIWNSFVQITRTFSLRS